MLETLSSKRQMYKIYTTQLVNYCEGKIVTSIKIYTTQMVEYEFNINYGVINSIWTLVRSQSR